LIGFDQDKDAMKNVIDDQRFMFIRSNFRYVKNFLQYHKLIPVDGVLADLGISSHQVDEAERGFSVRFEAELDMRMNTESGLTAKQVINDYPEEKLQQIFSEYGEIRNAKSVARKIVASRQINTTQELIKTLEPLAERGAESKFFAKIFQALRIEVNQELDALKEFLNSCRQIIKKDGRLVVLSYHSLEDRIVKNFLADRDAERDVITGQTSAAAFTVLNKKPVEPTEEEIKNNPRSRSAKMRVAIKN
jgi:16S rRNA (cytosine1402-N4)-methyltransferase